MINATSSAGMSMPPSYPPRNTAALSTDQQMLISETLSQYDADNLSEADARSIVATFQEAGIQPGKALEEAMSVAGFDARSIGDKGGPQGPRPSGPPPQGGGFTVSEDTLEELYTLLDQYYSEDTSATDKTGLQSSIQELLGTQTRMFETTA